MKKAYILHGWGGKPDGAFRPWLKKELEMNGYIVEVPALPNTDTPIYEEWISFLQKIIQNPDAETLLVGHSLSGLAVLHFLNDLPEGQIIGKVILVAPVIESIMGLSESDKEIFKPWYEKKLNPEKVQHSTNFLIGIFSDNDQWIPIESERILREKFGAKTIIEHNMGHFSDDIGVTQVPTILEQILN